MKVLGLNLNFHTVKLKDGVTVEVEGLKDLLWMAHQLWHIGLEVSQIFGSAFAFFSYFKQSQRCSGMSSHSS